MRDRKRMLDMAARFRTHAAETSSLMYAGLMLQVAQDLEEVALVSNALPSVSSHHVEKSLVHA